MAKNHTQNQETAWGISIR